MPKRLKIRMLSSSGKPAAKAAARLVVDLVDKPDALPPPGALDRDVGEAKAPTLPRLVARR